MSEEKQFIDDEVINMDDMDVFRQVLHNVRGISPVSTTLPIDMDSLVDASEK